MKVSEITNEIIREYCNIYEEESKLIPLFKDSAISYIKNQTGLSDEEINQYDDLTIGVLLLIGEMYDNRSATVEKGKVNEILSSIISSHCMNLL